MPGVAGLAEQKIRVASPVPDRWTGQDIAVPLFNGSEPAGFELDCGATLDGAEFLVRITGPAGAPLVAVSGGISANRFVSDEASNKGWWSALVAISGGIDLSKFRVLGFDFLPGDGTGIPAITTGDQARALAHALEFIGEPKLHAFVGSSYGGMVGLALAAEYPELLGRLCVISAAHRAHPMATAIRGIQRRILKFASARGCAEEGVALARQLAMTTYRTEDEFALRFASIPQGDSAGDPYDVCEYLISRGEDFAREMPVERLLLLSDSMDRHRVDPGRIATPTLVIGVESDRLVPLGDMRALVATLAGPAELVELQSTYGHDAFLLETKILAPLLHEFCEGETP
ncbi:MAG: homoserine O-succinyltransferase [Proteobacteria bacterium]|nr:homoserine O-succinyltransferase [Pseudomonadota bacterium]